MVEYYPQLFKRWIKPHPPDKSLSIGGFPNICPHSAIYRLVTVFTLQTV